MKSLPTFLLLLLFCFTQSSLLQSLPTTHLLYMAKHCHVPKFGNWDNENVPYTTYFENARNEKDKGAKMINPNDPEENPAAFSHTFVGIQQDYDRHHVVRAPPSRANSGSQMSVLNRKEGKEEISRQKSSLSQQKSGGRKSTSTQSGSDISSSDRSLIRANKHQYSRSSQKKSLGEGSNTFIPSSPHSQVKSFSHGSHRSDDSKTHKVASVPRFGSWDETDPKSGEGFTVIFNRVKEEKQIGASKFPATRSGLSVHAHGQRSSPPRSKICCCFPSGSSK